MGEREISQSKGSRELIHLLICPLALPLCASSLHRAWLITSLEGLVPSHSSFLSVPHRVHRLTTLHKTLLSAPPRAPPGLEAEAQALPQTRTTTAPICPHGRPLPILLCDFSILHPCIFTPAA